MSATSIDPQKFADRLKANSANVIAELLHDISMQQVIIEQLTEANTALSKESARLQQATGQDS